MRSNRGAATNAARRLRSRIQDRLRFGRRRGREEHRLHLRIADRQEIVRTREADEARERRGRRARVGEPARIERQHRGVVGTRAVTHQIDAAPVAAARVDVGELSTPPRPRCRPGTPDSRTCGSRAGSRRSRSRMPREAERVADEAVVGLRPRVPRAAVEEEHARCDRPGTRPRHVDVELHGAGPRRTRCRVSMRTASVAESAFSALVGVHPPASSAAVSRAHAAMKRRARHPFDTGRTGRAWMQALRATPAGAAPPRPGCRRRVSRPLSSLRRRAGSVRCRRTGDHAHRADARAQGRARRPPAASPRSPIARRQRAADQRAERRHRDRAGSASSPSSGPSSRSGVIAWRSDR